MGGSRNTGSVLLRISSAALVLLTVSCASYRTPGAGVSAGNLATADGDIAELMSRVPAAEFPVRLAIVRVQSTGYYSYSNQCYGQGRFCVVTTRDIETDSDIAKIASWPMILDIAALSRLLLPAQLNTLKDLRLAAASVKTDMLLVYSVDTRFTVESTEIGPLALISLGFLPNKKAHVATTASSVLVDVRTGFVYGSAEATAREQQRATVWSSTSAVEKARSKTEVEAFQKLLPEIEKLWKGVVEHHQRS
jgi:hypothetical protein